MLLSTASPQLERLANKQQDCAVVEGTETTKACLRSIACLLIRLLFSSLLLSSLAGEGSVTTKLAINSFGRLKPTAIIVHLSPTMQEKHELRTDIYLFIHSIRADDDGDRG